MQQIHADAPEYCYAPVNYMAGANTEAVDVSIHDARQAHFLDWHVNGFELVEHSSAVFDWQDARQVEHVHYPEAVALAQELSGCDVALVSSHISRNPAQAAVHEDYAPIQFVHSDFSDDYGERLLQLYQAGRPDTAKALATAGITVADMQRAKRLLILQFWRNVGPALMDLPLAFIDAQTVSKADVHAMHVPNYAGGDFAFDTLGVSAARSHRWYTYPQMVPHEVVAFRTFDRVMAAQGKPYWTPHSAFADPLAGANPPQRCSIEVRATCLFY